MGRPRIRTEEEARELHRVASLNWARRNKERSAKKSIEWAKGHPEKVKENRERYLDRVKSDPEKNVRMTLTRVLSNMMERCNNPNNKRYNIYGGRGIKVCKEWATFKNSFIEWSLANGYQKGLTIDRIDVNGNYEPDNCRWVTSKVQNNNRRDNVFIEIDGVRKTISQWAEQYGISKSLAWWRYKRGWPIESVFTIKPVRGNNQNLRNGNC